MQKCTYHIYQNRLWTPNPATYENYKSFIISMFTSVIM